MRDIEEIKAAVDYWQQEVIMAKRDLQRALRGFDKVSEELEQAELEASTVHAPGSGYADPKGYWSEQ